METVSSTVLSSESRSIEVTRDFLVLLLETKDWCKARQVGRALEILVAVGKQGPLTPRELEGTGEVLEDTRNKIGR